MKKGPVIKSGGRFTSPALAAPDRFLSNLSLLISEMGLRFPACLPQPWKNQMPNDTGAPRFLLIYSCFLCFSSASSFLLLLMAAFEFPLPFFRLSLFFSCPGDFVGGGTLCGVGQVDKEGGWQRWLGDGVTSPTAGPGGSCNGPAVLSGLALKT